MLISPISFAVGFIGLGVIIGWFSRSENRFWTVTRAGQLIFAGMLGLMAWRLEDQSARTAAAIFALIIIGTILMSLIEAGMRLIRRWETTTRRREADEASRPAIVRWMPAHRLRGGYIRYGASTATAGQCSQPPPADALDRTEAQVLRWCAQRFRNG